MSHVGFKKHKTVDTTEEKKRSGASHYRKIWGNAVRGGGNPNLGKEEKPHRVSEDMHRRPFSVGSTLGESLIRRLSILEVQMAPWSEESRERGKVKIQQREGSPASLRERKQSSA